MSVFATALSLLSLATESILPSAPAAPSAGPPTAPIVEAAVDEGAPPLADAAEASPKPGLPAAPSYEPGARQRRVGGHPRRGIHELRDPTGWPSEPQQPSGALDRARFVSALSELCDEVAPQAGLETLAGTVFDASVTAEADPFTIGGIAYSAGRCRPGLSGASGVGLLQIQPHMFSASARLPFPRSDLAPERLLDPAHNVRVGAALLAMWDAEHEALDAASGSTPHRSAVAHLHWGDRVWSATPEDRALTARRRLLELYAGRPPGPGVATLGFTIVPPLDGIPRLGTSGPGADRAGGKRTHKGIDIDASVGEPVRAVASGVVLFAGLDMPGRRPARAIAPNAVSRYVNRRLGPGGVFVRIVHDDGLRTGYFHLHSFNVVPGQRVDAGEVIGTVGRSGVKSSPSHLHFEVHGTRDVEDPVEFLSAFVLRPTGTLQHDVAMAQKQQRLERASRRSRRLGRSRVRVRTTSMRPDSSARTPS